MSYRALFLSIGLALMWTGIALWAMRPADPAPLRTFVAFDDKSEYHVSAHEARVEGFCTVFIRNGVRIAAVCGSHTWSESVEVQ